MRAAGNSVPTGPPSRSSQDFSILLIHGRGTYQILGGTGRFAGSTGAGTVSTEAIVTEAVPGGVTGTFDPLAFAGTLAP